MMRFFRIFVLAVYLGLCYDGFSCTIVAVSGRVTEDGRPLLLKNRDSESNNLRIRIGFGERYVYLSQSLGNNGTLSGYNETGFTIVNSHSYNMPNSSAGWNSYIMQLAVEHCSTVEEFQYLLDTISKPMSVAANYGVMDAQGQVAIFETNSYSYTRYDADSADCGYLIRTNFSFSQDTNQVSQVSPTSIPRYQITSSYLENAFLLDGYISKEHLFGLVRCLANSDGQDLRDMAPFDENIVTPVDFRYYVPRYTSTSAMVIQGLLPREEPYLTVAWTMVGPPLTSVTVPYLITPRYVLPQKAIVGAKGCSWFRDMGQRLKGICFMDNVTLDLAKLYNLSGSGIMQKISVIEEEILLRGNKLVDKMRQGGASCFDVEAYYAWVDNYVEEQYEAHGLIATYLNNIKHYDENRESQILEYYDVLGRCVKKVRSDAIILKRGKIGIILN